MFLPEPRQQEGVICSALLGQRELRAPRLGLVLPPSPSLRQPVMGCDGLNPGKQLTAPPMQPTPFPLLSSHLFHSTG